jgi:cytochrome c
MKKILLIAPLFILLSACGNDSSKDEKVEEKKTDTVSKQTTTPTDDLSSNPVYQKGLQLEAQSDCATCHRVDEKLQGPSFREIANKYASMPDTIVGHLAGKIITGGKGVWGEIMMTPHPALSNDDAEALVKYIFLFKK